MEVTWTPAEQTLLHVGKLQFAPPPERPHQPTVKEQKHKKFLDRKARRAPSHAAPRVAPCP
jgi:hypothetical protein